MGILFLFVIYLSFVSLGLPDTLLGSAWPVMRPELGVSLDAQGLITLVVSLATICSCLLTDQFVRRLGTAKIAVLSGIVTAASLLGYAWAPGYIWFILFSVPLGLGAGAVDTCLNNYAALYFPARHVNWMTCCYAVGAAAGPFILSFLLEGGGTWRGGYFVISMIQFAISAFLIVSLPVWKGRDHKGADKTPRDEEEPAYVKKPLLLIRGVAPALICYALFFAIQYGTALWSPSYLVEGRGFLAEGAARTASLFYACVMIGRFVSGAVSEKLSDKTLLRIGASFCIIGTFLFTLPLPQALYFPVTACIGLGCAPIFPSMIHMTPARFGRRDSQRVMGVQMAAAYIGNMAIVPLIGVTAERVGIYAIPWFLFFLCVLLLCLSEWVDYRCARSGVH